ncbi:hypothetical protein AB0A77_17515 [Streptomyces varsoviensis]|uniref:hypothetical protein n=1 Tax=Streptomyces varsoviensis TaxID=67373 RepID=UPI0033CAC6C4
MQDVADGVVVEPGELREVIGDLPQPLGVADLRADDRRGEFGGEVAAVDAVPAPGGPARALAEPGGGPHGLRLAPVFGGVTSDLDIARGAQFAVRPVVGDAPAVFEVGAVGLCWTATE